MFEEVLAEGYTPVVYLNPEVFKKVEPSTRDEVLERIKASGLKVYSPATSVNMRRCKKLYVYRYGVLSDAVERFVRSKGGKVVGGFS